MLTGSEAIAALRRAGDAGERSRSSYWEAQVARVDPETGAGPLGSLSPRRSAVRAAAHRFLQLPFRFMARGCESFAECERLGRLIADRLEREFTHDMLRQTLALAHIRTHIQIDGPNGERDSVNLVIGDGYGTMASLLLLAAPARKVVTVNLTLPLTVDLNCIARAVPGAGIALAVNEADMCEALADQSIRIIGVQADNAAVIADAPVALAINIVSMQEMDPPVIADYFRILRATPAARTAFYCCNKLVKHLPDGSEIRFADYPWREADEHLFDCICPWQQLYYSKTPPFWHYRRGAERVIWHRLSWLDKNRVG